MKTILYSVAIVSLCCHTAFAQEVKKAAGEDSKQTGNPKSGKPISQEELETKFKTLLTQATLSGRWSPIENGQLGPEKKEDKYSIVGADKIQGDQWIIKARMKYGGSEFVIPVPVQVRWSADTPVLIVNDFSMGGNNSYSARVLFYENSYSGSWSSSSGHGGLLYGTIVRESDSPSKSTESKSTEKK